MAHICYRITKTDPPTEADFLSYRALGRKLTRTDPRSLRQAEGLSVYLTEEHARANARRWPRIGSYIARLEIPDGAPVTVEGVGEEANGHHTLYGAPADVLACITRPLVPVEPDPSSSQAWPQC